MKAFITSHPHTAEHTPALVDDAYRMADAFIQQGEPSSNGNENAVNLKLAAALKEALDWAEDLRASGDAGNWNWAEGDFYSKGLALLKRSTLTKPYSPNLFSL